MPRNLQGIIGIITAPLLHANFQHIFSNSIPLLVLGTFLVYFYKPVAIPVFLITYFFSGTLVWLLANWGDKQQHIHIGASGVVYGLYAFLFISGIIRKNKSLFGITLIVTFLYGTVIWGVLPVEFQKAILYTQESNISWQGHLAGFLTGTVLAFAYKKEGLPDPVYSWDMNNDADVDESNPYWLVQEQVTTATSQEDEELIKNVSDNPITIQYTFIPKKDEQNNSMDKNI